MWQPYGIVRTRPTDPADATRSSGVGGVDIRGKINPWGNGTFDKPGDTAFGLLPFITLPTNRSNGISPEAVEGGLILPFAVKLTDKFGLGLNTGVNVVKNSDMSGYHAEWLGSASLAYEWSENLGSYYEVAARTGTRNPLGDTVVLATGLTYRLNKNLQLDAGINVGVTRADDRINPFVGISKRYPAHDIPSHRLSPHGTSRVPLSCRMLARCARDAIKRGAKRHGFTARTFAVALRHAGAAHAGRDALPRCRGAP